MNNHWAAEQLQVIRTLMERSALYRRALAPIMTCVGTVGILAALAGWLLDIHAPRAFVGYWMCVGAVAAAAALLLVRRQALNDKEPFWSLPTRRVAQALLPPFLVGFGVSLMILIFPNLDFVGGWGLPVFWMLLYACGMHAAGFFTARGIKLFSWIFLLAGGALIALHGATGNTPDLAQGHAVMGFGFGGLHLACGVYLYFTEKGGKAT